MKLVKNVVLVCIKVNKKVKITDISTNLFDASQGIVLLCANFQKQFYDGLCLCSKRIYSNIIEINY